MDPIAFHLGPLTVRWYGIMVASAFLVGFFTLQRRARSREGIDEETAGNLTLAAMLGGIVGARILYVAQNWPEFRGHPLEMLRIDHGGLVFYGGFFGAVAAVGLYCLRKKLPAGEAADLAAPVLPLAHAVGRVGCFLNGCCFGKPFAHFPHVQYLPGSDVQLIQRIKGLCPPDSPTCLPVFPIQLVNSLTNLAIFALLLWFEKRLERRGQLFALYIVFYSFARFCTEFGRGDYLNYVGPFTPAQAVCLVLFPAGIVLFLALGRYGRPTAAQRA